MLRHYALIAWRQLRRHKMFSALNIFCLATGLGVCLLIGAYVQEELAVNHGLKDAKDLYFLNSDWKVAGSGLPFTTVGPLARALATEYPALAAGYYRMNPVTNTISAGDLHFRENIAIGDTTLISLFGLPMIAGDPAHAFPNNRSALITARMAKKLFGTTDAVGRTITLTNIRPVTTDYRVSGVLADLPRSTLINYVDKDGYDVFVPFEGNQYYPTGGSGEEDWKSAFLAGFLKLRPGVKPEALQAPALALLKKNSPPAISGILTPVFRPLTRYYLEANDGAVLKTLRILSVVAGCILLLAMINFINISIGASAYRMREIGLRKVFGGGRRQLVTQYLGESVLLAVCAGVVATGIYFLLRPGFSRIWDTPLPGWREITAIQGAAFAGFVVLTGVLAGLYPAIRLSAVDAAISVKGKFSQGEKAQWLRKSLLVAQFALASGIFIFSLTLSRQIDYFFEKDQGYNRDQLLVVTALPKQWDSAGERHMEAVRDALLGVPGVRNATISFEVPDRVFNSALAYPEGRGPSEAVSFFTSTVDGRFGQTYGLKMAEGQFFPADGTGTPGQAVINESMRRAFGWKTAVGKKIHYPAFPNSDVVIGVVRDFNMGTMTQAVTPMILSNVRDAQSYRYMTMKLGAGDIPATLERIKAKWRELSPTAPFDYHFMDENFRALIATELRLQKAAGVATALMILIVALGLAGLLSQSLARRDREIAVRKVLGADIRHIVGLFLKQYASLIAIGFAIACPLAWWITAHWLDQYAYRVRQSPYTYLIVGFAIAGGAFALIGLQCLRKALANPVTALRNE